MAEKTVIHDEGLTKYYGKTRGVEGLNLSVYEGEIFGFLGPNGAGKSTTIRLLLGLIRPTGGRVSVLGFDCWNQAVLVKQITGFVSDNVRLYENLTGEQLLDYVHGFQPHRKVEWRDKLVQRFDLDLSFKIKDYSRGNRQKLALVAALMHRPPILILDEPTIGLDPLMQQEFYYILKEYREKGGTVFMSSHFLPEVEKAENLKYFTLFHYYKPAQVLRTGVLSARNVAFLGMIFIVFTVLAVFIFKNRDIAI